MKQVEAQIEIEINTVCPHCEVYLDLLDNDEFPNLNEEGFLNTTLLGKTFGCRNWNEKIICPVCKKEFEVTDVYW
jgi:uncharacterized protein YbaR (Trm112 family)